MQSGVGYGVFSLSSTTIAVVVIIGLVLVVVGNLIAYHHGLYGSPRNDIYVYALISIGFVPLLVASATLCTLEGVWSNDPTGGTQIGAIAGTLVMMVMAASPLLSLSTAREE